MVRGATTETDSTPDGMLAVTDPDGTIVFTNELFKEKLGTEDHSINRFHFFDFLDEGRGLLLDAYGGSPGTPRSELFEIQFRSMGGSRFPGLLSVSPILSDGETIGYPPESTRELARCKPVYEEMPGWTEDITEAKEYDDLPENARDYVERLEDLLGVDVSAVSVGAGREQTIFRDETVE